MAAFLPPSIAFQENIFVAYVLQNVVLPIERDPDLLPLYVDSEIWSVIDEAPVRVSNRAHLGNVLGRHRSRIVAGRRVSFASYFNAFPASYWQHWTTVRQVSLTVRTNGPATILVYRSNGGATQQRIATREVSGTATTSFDLPLTQFSDGGWMWFDIVADESNVTFEGAEWTTEEGPSRTGLASLGITTYNKPDYCLATLEALAAEPEVLELIDRIFLIDQGTQRVDAEDGFDAVSARLGEQLQVITQANLGGSGGFSRAMAETLKRPESDFVQLLDDDVTIEPESLRRSIIFGQYATTPTLVGGHMFDLLDRPKLHAWAEVVDNDPFMWRNLFQEVMPHNFNVTNLRQTPVLHMRLDADYNGWWMCLIPLDAIREVGLAIPGFIKWDDAEFCLRAGEAGFATVSMPGVALWHVSWVGKDDSIDWQAYFHARNRFVAALLHSRSPHGGRLLRHSRRVDVKHLLMMQYYPVELRHRALNDILSGPAHMHRTLATAMPAARAISAEFPETTVFRDSDTVLRSRRGRQVYKALRQNTYDSPTGMRLRLFTANMLVSHWFHAARPENIAQPEVEFGKGDANWWRLPRFDSALVSAADGSGKNVYTRDRKKFRFMVLRSWRLHRRLQREWPRLAAEYQAAQPEFTSLSAWEQTFGVNK